MRYIVVLISLVWVPIFVTAQSTILRATFYGLPVDAPRNIIKSAIIADPRFSQEIDSDTSFLSRYTNTFYGKIKHFDRSLQYKVDSATIELTLGYGTNAKSRKRSLALTFVKLKYYVADVETSNGLAKELWDRHKFLASDTFDITVGRREENNFAFGKKAILKSKKSLPSLSVLQNNTNLNCFLVELEYVRYGD